MSDKKTAPEIKADHMKTMLANLESAKAENVLPSAPQVTSDQLNLVRNTIAKDATPDELKLFLFDCARQGVHPLDRLIHFTVRTDKRTGERRYTPVTSIDFMRIRAADSGEYAGSDDVVYGDTQGLPEVPVTATVTVWRLVQGQRCSFTATARWAEYKPDQAFMWHKMPFLMLGKCAEALALRKGFPKQLAGLYAKEEMDQAENEEPRQKAADLAVKGRGVDVPSLRPGESVTVTNVAGEQRSASFQKAAQKPQDAPRREKASAADQGAVPEPQVGREPLRGWAHTHSPETAAIGEAIIKRHRETSSDINPYTGEEYPPCPAGAAYVWKYELDNGWHRGWLSSTGHAQIEVKTKYDTGLLLQGAAESHKPVVYSANAKGFLSKLDWWVGGIAKKLAEAGVSEDEPPPLTDEDIVF